MNLSLVQGRWEVSSEVCWPGVGMMWPSLMFVQEKEGSEDRGGCIRQGMCFLTIYFFVAGAFFYGWLSLATLISSHWKTRGLIVFLLSNGLLIGLASPGALGKVVGYSALLAGYLDERLVHQLFGALEFGHFW